MTSPVELAYRATTPAAPQAITDANPLPVGVTSIIPGTGATNLGKAEDAAHTSGDTGVPAWGVRNDNGATLTRNTARSL